MQPLPIPFSEGDVATLMRSSLIKAAAVLISFLSLVSAGPSNSGAQIARSGCPSTTTAPGPYGPESLLRAIRRDVPRTFKLTNEQGPIRLTPKIYRIVATLSLLPTSPRIGGAATHYHTVALKKCGTKVADNSWAVMLHFPTAQTVFDARGVALFAHTTKGWRIWFHTP